MVRGQSWSVLLFLFGVFVMAKATPVDADTLTWQIKSDYSYAVDLEFYARDRSHIWPGGGKVYVIRDSDVHTYTLQCRTGEWICFGAWVRGISKKYWGVGKNRRSGCKRCCYKCNGGQTDLRNLTPHSPSALRDKNRRY